MSHSIKKAVGEERCSRMPVNLKNAGKFIKQNEAIKSLEAYFVDARIPDPTAKEIIFGHTFGLNKVRKLLDNIDEYNNKVDQEEKEIKGIRIYYGYGLRHDPEFGLEPKDGPFRDVFLMPVLASGEDLYGVYRLVEEDLILSESRPCPNQCGLTISSTDLVIK
ncbi:hypothetical protein [Pedobacter nototheniae]|uniref:hypothetical protein n=1 Tax=Pedobacter nototheniae TaxID=2488994 RepID=UPI00292D0CF4|nr:hypothetical protein [Pedobacter nototheniae]